MLWATEHPRPTQVAFRVRLSEVTTAQVAIVISGFAAIVGAFGAINSHRALRWQKRRDEQRRQLRARLAFRHEPWQRDPRPRKPRLGSGEEMGDGIAWFTVRADVPLEYRLSIIVVNESEEATIFVRHLFVEQPDGERRHSLTIEPSDHRLEPHQQLVRRMFVDDVDIDLMGGFVAEAHTGHGIVRSEVEHLDAALLQHIAEHNARERTDGPAK
jgi:hypothetical protein